MKRPLQGEQIEHRYKKRKGWHEWEGGTEAAEDGLEKVCAEDRAAQLARTKIMREFESNANCLILHKMFS